MTSRACNRGNLGRLMGKCGFVGSVRSVRVCKGLGGCL